MVNELLGWVEQAGATAGRVYRGFAATRGAATPNLLAQVMPNEFMLDFLTDYPWSDAFSVGSTWFTQHRLMNQNPDDLKLFSAGI